MSSLYFVYFVVLCVHVIFVVRAKNSEESELPFTALGTYKQEGETVLALLCRRYGERGGS